MQTIEITAKSVEEATQMAAKKLGANADQIEVTVLEQTKGLFGKGTVRVRAELKGGATAEPEAAAEPEAKPAPKGRAKAAAKPAAKGKAKAAPVEDSGVEAAPAVAAVEVAEDSEKSDEGAEAGPEVEASAKDEARIVALVTDLMESASLEATVTGVSRSGKYVNVSLDGKDVAHLVGKHGEVLNALQYLLNVTISQQVKNGVRVTIDGQNYRLKREEALTKLATQIANEVSKRQEEAVLDALPAFERRIIHKVLAEIEGVTTYSEGEEPNRRVVIAPSES